MAWRRIHSRQRVSAGYASSSKRPLRDPGGGDAKIEREPAPELQDEGLQVAKDRVLEILLQVARRDAGRRAAAIEELAGSRSLARRALPVTDALRAGAPSLGRVMAMQASRWSSRLRCAQSPHAGTSFEIAWRKFVSEGERESSSRLLRPLPVLAHMILPVRALPMHVILARRCLAGSRESILVATAIRLAGGVAQHLLLAEVSAKARARSDPAADPHID